MTPSPLAPWRDASLILLSLPAFISALIPLAILYLINRGVRWLVVRTRPAFRVVQEKADLAAGYVDLACQKIAWPFIALRGLAAGMRQGAKALYRLVKRRRGYEATRPGVTM